MVAKDVIKVISNYYCTFFGYDSCSLSRPFFCYMTKLLNYYFECHSLTVLASLDHVSDKKSSLVFSIHWLRAGRSTDRMPVGARFSAPVQTSPGAHPTSCTMGTRSFPGVKSGQGVMLTTHPLLVPQSWKGRAIPLLPQWAERPVQSLSACTRVHFTLPQCLCKGDLYLLPLVYKTYFCLPVIKQRLL